MLNDIEDKKDRGIFIEHVSCPYEDCGSSDAMAIYFDGQSENGWCYSCERYSDNPRGLIDKTSNEETKTQPETRDLSKNTYVTESFRRGRSDTDRSSDKPEYLPKLSVEEGLVYPIIALTNRKISKSTAEHFGVRAGVSSVDGETPIFTLFPRFQEGNQVGWKTKSEDKRFTSTGGGDVELFGQNVCKPSGKKLWITEGEEDAMSLFEALVNGSSYQDWKPDVVSLPDGASSCTKSITNNFEFVNSFEEIILVYDNDSAGIKARKECCKLLAGKVSYVTLPLKDANEMLLAGRSTDLKWAALTHTIKYQPDGIIDSKELWTRFTEKQDIPSYLYPSFMPELNKKTYGVRAPSIVTFAAGTGVGKTQTLRELLYHFWNTTDEKIAGMFLEEDVSDTVSGLLSIVSNTRLGIPGKTVPQEQMQSLFDDVFGSGRISLYDYFGGMDDNNLLSKLKYFAVTGHKFIFLDHLSIVVSEFAASGGERERIDTLMTKLAKFVKEFNVILIGVVHLRKSDSSRVSFEEGAVPTLDDLRGSSSIKQLSWDVIFASRNQQHEDPVCRDIIEFSVGKCRLTGDTGVADYVKFNRATGRFENVEKPLNYRPTKKSKVSLAHNNNEEF